MRPQLWRREAKKIKSATSTVDDSVAAVQTNPKRANVFASGLIEMRHNRSAVSITSTVHDRAIATVTSRGVTICWACSLTVNYRRPMSPGVY
jgi:hypothetical protein